MKYTITYENNWLTALANAMFAVNDGDVIAVPDERMKHLAERSKARVCPMKQVKIEIQKQEASSLS